MVKVITAFVYHHVDDSHAVVFYCMQYYLSHPPLQEIQAIYSLQLHFKEGLV